MRRQQRKINKLLRSTKYESLFGSKIDEITTDQLYKYVKERKVEYDDFRAMDLINFDNLDHKLVEEFIRKAKLVADSKQKEQFEIRRANRRSSRLNDKQDDDSYDNDTQLVGFLVLVRIAQWFDNK